MFKRIVIIVIALANCACMAQRQNVSPYFAIRSQGRNAARQIVGLVHYVMTNTNSILAATPSYSRSFRSHEINRCLFADLLQDEKETTIAISGSRTDNRGDNDILADYLYLPTDFKSSMSFKPVIDNVSVDFQWHINFDNWCPGLYSWLYTPLVFTRWHLDPCEQVEKSGTLQHDPGYFAPDAISRGKLLPQANNYFAGDMVTDIPGMVLQKLKFGKISQKKKKRTRLAEIRFAFGYNFTQSRECHVGFNVQTAAPTGSRPEAKFLFEPIVGNSHHWEFGAGFNAHYTKVCGKSQETELTLYGDINITHLFSSKQKRTFDLVNGNFSRYMIAQKFGLPIVDLFNGPDSSNLTVSSSQFKNEFAPVANITTLDVKTSISAQVDFVTLFAITSCDYSFDIGYNFWARSRENIKLQPDNIFANNATWTLKGDSHQFGYLENSPNSIALAATQQSATIHAGNNFPASGTTDPTMGKKNPNIDNAINAFADPGPPVSLVFAPNTSNGANQIQTSEPALFIKESDLDIKNAETAGMSSKVFANFSYSWTGCNDTKVFIGIGGEAEFGHNRDNSFNKTDNTPCPPCNKRHALSQWSVWVKGGAQFD